MTKENETETTEKTRALLLSKRLFIFDMDGTVYLGGVPFPYAVRMIRNLRESGRQVLFFTNNASHGARFYQSKLSQMGFDPREGEIFTSGDVTAAYLNARHPGRRVYLVGTPELWREFRRAGIPLACDEQGEPTGDAEIVVSSFDTSLTYRKLETACRLIRGGAAYLCTHPDFNCPTEDGMIPDSGAIAALITASTGKTPTYFGKPCPETAAMISAMTGTRPEEMCVFGDRLYTDIALGRRFGMTACLVLSGETDAAAAAAASQTERPDVIFPSLAEADELLFRQ